MWLTYSNWISINCLLFGNLKYNENQNDWFLPEILHRQASLFQHSEKLELWCWSSSTRPCWWCWFLSRHLLVVWGSASGSLPWGQGPPPGDWGSSPRSPSYPPTLSETSWNIWTLKYKMWFSCTKVPYPFFPAGPCQIRYVVTAPAYFISGVSFCLKL